MTDNEVEQLAILDSRIESLACGIARMKDKGQDVETFERTLVVWEGSREVLFAQFVLRDGP